MQATDFFTPPPHLASPSPPTPPVRYEQLRISDLRLACALLDLAELRDTLGLRQDAEELNLRGLRLLCDWVHCLGLKEMQVCVGGGSLSAYLSNCLSIYLSTYLSTVSIYLSISIYQSIY